MISRFAATLLLCLPLAAHDLETSVQLAAPAVIVRAAYGGSEPVAFAKFQVYSPDSPDAEFQTGVTDRRGYFSFVPDQPGSWRIVVDDEEGHRREARVPVPAPFGSNAAQPSPALSRLERALLGIVLILAATAFLYGFTARRSARRPS
jgi:nickel transport protein